MDVTTSGTVAFDIITSVITASVIITSGIIAADAISMGGFTGVTTTGRILAAISAVGSSRVHCMRDSIG